MRILLATLACLALLSCVIYPGTTPPPRFVVIETQTELRQARDVERELTDPQEARFTEIASIHEIRSRSTAGLSVVELEFDGHVTPADLAAARTIARYTFRERAAFADSLAIYVSPTPVVPR